MTDTERMTSDDMLKTFRTSAEHSLSEAETLAIIRSP